MRYVGLLPVGNGAMRFAAGFLPDSRTNPLRKYSAKQRFLQALDFAVRSPQSSRLPIIPGNSGSGLWQNDAANPTTQSYPTTLSMKKSQRKLRRSSLSLGDLILAVSSCSRNSREAAAAVADLLESGQVRLMPQCGGTAPKAARG